MPADTLHDPNLEPDGAAAGFGRSASAAMRGLEAVVESVAASETPILLVGENGVGKRSLARYIHTISSRRDQSLSQIRCLNASAEAFPSNGVSGHSSKLAAIGTVLLDEIADLSSTLQSRALHYFFGKTLGESPRPRLIASTVRDLEHETRSGRFREDLYYQTSGIRLLVPPLRHRREDILPLAEHFLDHYSRVFSRSVRPLSVRLQHYLLEHNWPGNIRELENAVKTLVAVGDEQVAMLVLRSTGLESRVHNSDPGEVVSLKQAAREASRHAERELILRVLSRTRWNRKRAAQELQISYKALLYKLKQIGLDDDKLSSEEMFV